MTAEKTKEKKPRGREKSLRSRISTVVMCGPMTIWSVLFILIPVVLLVVMSFMTKGALGQVVYRFTTQNYTDILKPVYFKVVRESLLIAFWLSPALILDTTVSRIPWGYFFIPFFPDIATPPM